MLTITFFLSSVGMYLGMRESIHVTVDRALATRLEGVHKFMWRHLPGRTPAEYPWQFLEHSGVRIGGDLYQVMDLNGEWLYQTPSMVPLSIPGEVPDPASPRHYATIQRMGGELRLLSATVDVDKKLYTVQVVTIMSPFYHILARFKWIVIVLFPLIAIFSGAGGYWLSGRAMGPVYEITRTAQSISEENLSKRLIVPEARDELRLLSETVNAMLFRLETAFKRVTQFTADASHDLRTPIAMIRTTAELILEKRRTVSEYEELVGQILVESEAASDLLEKLLTLARADAHAVEIRLSPTDLCEVARDLVSSVTSLSDEKGILFSLSLPSDSVVVPADQQALRRLMLILIDNAIKYTPGGGHVFLSVQTKSSSTFIEVEDSGIGISPEDLPHIFERFYRADKARPHDLGGSGLGLAIAKTIADAHRARIEVESTPEQGSVFRVVFSSNIEQARELAPATIHKSIS